MTRLLDDLLVLAGSDQEGIELSLARVDLADLARSAGRAAARLAADAGLTFDAVVDGALMVRADAERLREVLLILLDNAVKYTPSGGRITLRARQRARRGDRRRRRHRRRRTLGRDTRACSIASTASTRHARERSVAPAWGSRSRARSWTRTAARCSFAASRGRAAR